MTTAPNETVDLATPARVDSDPVAVLPLTERVLRRLPGSRLLWIVLWAMVVPLRLLDLLVVLALTGDSHPTSELVEVFISQGIFSYVIVVLLWGTARLVDRVTALAPAIDRLTASDADARPFSRVTSVRGPLGLAVLAVAIATPSTIAQFGVLVGIVDLPLLFVTILPIMTFIWTYGSILVGLDRLGQSRLALDLFPQDRSLGLGPVGGAAMFGFWLIVVAAVPLLVVAGSDLTTFGLSVGVVLITVLLFILSMLRLHGQMRSAKGRYVAMTHALVAEAYEPVRSRTDLQTLQASSSALGAAQSLAERAERILEWPIDERMVALMTVVVTGVVTSLIVRLVLQAFGV